jgi:hypothetical protein
LTRALAEHGMTDKPTARKRKAAPKKARARVAAKKTGKKPGPGSSKKT